VPVTLSSSPQAPSTNEASTTADTTRLMPVWRPGHVAWFPVITAQIALLRSGDGTNPARGPPARGRHAAAEWALRRRPRPRHVV